MDPRMQFNIYANEQKVEELLKYPINLTDSVRKAVEETESFKQECAEVSRKAEVLGKLLRTAARFANVNPAGLYESPTRRIVVEVEKTLEKAHTLVKKCKRSGMLKRVITITNVSDFRRLNQHLDNSTVDVQWLLNISASGDEREDFTGLPPIASTDPILAMVWEQISIVHIGPLNEKAAAASYLADLAKDSRNAKIIVEEGGVQPLLRLLRDGNVGAQEEAAKALGRLAGDMERIRRMRLEGAISAFVQILGHGSMKVQAMVAWALSEFCDKDEESQTEVAVAGGIRLLVYLLAHDTIEDSQKTKSSVHAVVTTTMGHSKGGENQRMIVKPNDPDNSFLPGRTHLSPADHRTAGDSWTGPGDTGRTQSFPASLRTISKSSRDSEDPETKIRLKSEAARALWKAAENNVKNSKSITDTRALLCFAKLIETGKGDLQYNCIMAAVVIAAAAEKDVELRRAAFKTVAPAAKAIVDQLLRVIQTGEPELQEQCLKAIGCLARIFPQPARHVIGPVTKALSGPDARVVEQAALALFKFATPENFLWSEHSKTIMEMHAVMYMTPWLNSTMDIYTQVAALKLLCCLSINVPDHPALAAAMALQIIENMARTQVVAQNPQLRILVSDAIQKLEMYQASVHTPHNMVAPYES